MPSNTYILRRTGLSTLRYYLTGPVLVIAAALALIAVGGFAGGLVTRYLTPPTQITQVTVNSPTMSQRVNNNELTIIDLNCQSQDDSEGRLRVTVTTKRMGYITVAGPNDSEAKTYGSTAFETPITDGEYTLTFSEPSADLAWSTTGPVACSQRSVTAEATE